MERTGLAALAETYAFSRTELSKVAQLDARLLDRVRGELYALCSASLELFDFSDRIECYGDFEDRLDQNAFGVSIMARGELICIVVFERSIARALLDALLGEPVSTSDTSKTLTLVQTRILNEAVGRAVEKAVNEAWDATLDLEATPARIATGEAPAISLARSERIITAQSKVRIANVEGTIAISHIVATLMPFRARLQNSAGFEGDQVQAGSKSAASPILNSRFQVQAIVGQLAIPLARIAAWKPGDVVMLGQHGTNAPRVGLRCEGKLLFQGTVVETHGRLSFLIQEKGFGNGKGKFDYIH